MGWDRLDGRQWLGVLLGVLGVVVALSDRLGRPPSASALGWTLIGLGGLAGGSLLQGRLLGRGGPTALTAVQVAAGAVTTAFWAPFDGSLRIPETASARTSFGWLLLGEPVGVVALAGLGIAALGLWLGRRRPAPTASPAPVAVGAGVRTGPEPELCGST